jgi:hypothetical protein
VQRVVRGIELIGRQVLMIGDELAIAVEELAGGCGCGMEYDGVPWLPTMSSTTFRRLPCIARVKPAKSKPGLGRCSSSL